MRDRELLFHIIKTAFSQRRKTLLNCFFNAGGWELTKEELVIECGDAKLRMSRAAIGGVIQDQKPNKKDEKDAKKENK